MYERMYDTILVPLDGSSLAESVLPWVEKLAKELSSTVILATVAELPQERYGTGAGLHFHAPLVPGATPEAVNEEEEPAPEVHREYLEQHLEHLELEIKGYLTGIEANLKKMGIDARSVVLWGHPAEQIVDYAKDNGVDIIAMATHGRSGLTRWVYGSVTDKVLRAAKVPVLLIRAQAVAQKPSK